jgi:hypothetical protein
MPSRLFFLSSRYASNGGSSILHRNSFWTAILFKASSPRRYTPSCSRKYDEPFRLMLVFIGAITVNASASVYNDVSYNSVVHNSYNAARGNQAVIVNRHLPAIQDSGSQKAQDVTSHVPSERSSQLLSSHSTVHVEYPTELNTDFPETISSTNSISESSRDVDDEVSSRDSSPNNTAPIPSGHTIHYPPGVRESGTTGGSTEILLFSVEQLTRGFRSLMAYGLFSHVIPRYHYPTKRVHHPRPWPSILIPSAGPAFILQI